MAHSPSTKESSLEFFAVGVVRGNLGWTVDREWNKCGLPQERELEWMISGKG